MLPQLNKILLLSFIGITLSLIATSQISGRYVIGGFGNMGSTEPTFSAPVIFESAKCLEVANGIRTLLNSKQGNFMLTCPETQFLELQVLAYPNPVTDFLNIKVLNPRGLTNDDTYYLNVQDFTGRVLQVVKTDLSALLNGTRIPVMNLLQGNYIISLFSTNARLQSIKFIKNTK
jgi:hypothetical protein